MRGIGPRTDADGGRGPGGWWRRDQAKQKGYVKGVAERIKRASRYQFALEVDEKRSRGPTRRWNTREAARGRKAKRAELAEPKDEGPDLMREKLRASGDMVLRRLHERQ
ncbi:MAG: hypothetical protein ACLSAF_06070 [Intestinimonas sp.]